MGTLVRQVGSWLIYGKVLHRRVQKSVIQVPVDQSWEKRPVVVWLEWLGKPRARLW